jgi:hypothetical protein
MHIGRYKFYVKNETELCVIVTLLLTLLFLFSSAVTDPKELATGLEKREILNDEAGRDPVCYCF